MVKSFGVPAEDISYYAGITGAMFSLSQFFTGVMWGRLSDRIGRKPIILFGLVGTFTSLVLFVRLSLSPRSARCANCRLWLDKGTGRR